MDGIEGVATPQSNYEKYKDMFTKKNNDLITMDNFYQLLVAEMQNQDPLEPTSNTEFISQMASFAAMQSQQDAFKVQEKQYTDSLVGKTVTVRGDVDNLVTGVVTSVTHGDEEQIMVNGKNYKLSALSQVHAADQTVSGIGDHGAFAAGLLGKTVLVQSMDNTGATFIDEGEVKSLEVKDGQIRLVVNDYAYDVSDVLRVTETVGEEAAVNYYEEDEDMMPAAENNSAAAEQTVAKIGNSVPAVQTTEEPDIDDIVELQAANDQMLRELFE